MGEREPSASPVKTKAVLVDAHSMLVTWMNEAAQKDAGLSARELAEGVAIERAIPMAAMLGLAGVLRTVAETGEPRHVRTSLVSTARGGLDVATSVYALPGDSLLVLTDNAWQPTRRLGDDGDDREPRRRSGLPGR